MKGADHPAARRTLAAYASAGPIDRWHVRTRWWTCPFPLVEAAVPRRGRILEVGCGHGLLSLYLAAVGADRQVTGTDVDDAKLAVARVAATALGAAADFVPAVDGRLPDGRWDAVVIVDVLYLLGPDAAGRLLDECAAALAPGGVVVVKETGRHPRWKWAVSALQERLATRVLRITEGDHVAFLDAQEVSDRLAGAGLDVVHRRADAGYPHPHHLVVARRTTRPVPLRCRPAMPPGGGRRPRPGATPARSA